jgi:hypothetical protein
MAEGLKLNEMWENARSGYQNEMGRFERKTNRLDKLLDRQAHPAGIPNRGITSNSVRRINAHPMMQVEKFMKSKMGPNVATVGLGIGALGQLGNMRQRLRYHDYGGAALSGGMAAAMGYGAYLMGWEKNVMSRHLKDAAMMAGKHSYGIRGAARAVGQMMKI